MSAFPNLPREIGNHVTFFLEGGTPSCRAMRQWEIRREGDKLIISNALGLPLYVNGFAATAGPHRPTWVEGGWLRGQVAVTVRRRALDLTEVLNL